MTRRKRQKLNLEHLFKRLLYPGLDLHTRCRYRFLPEWFLDGGIETLDAGFGNGAFSYAAYCKGNGVLGVTISQDDLDRTAAFFKYMGISDHHIELQRINIYDLGRLNRQFDQIICLETLEHLKYDTDVVQMFGNLLRPKGRLILCCPNALHPIHKLGRTNDPETGGHVRDGYTMESYIKLLEPTGLHTVTSFGIGSPLLVWLDNLLRTARTQIGERLSVPLFLLILPLTWLDHKNPDHPFSLVIIAEKPEH